MSCKLGFVVALALLVFPAVAVWALFSFRRMRMKFANQCDHDFYDIRYGACKYAEVIAGRVVCSNPLCHINKKPNGNKN